MQWMVGLRGFVGRNRIQMFSIQRAADGAASVAARLLRYLPATAAHSTNAANSSTISGIDFGSGEGFLRRGWLTPVARPAVGLLLGVALVAGGAGALPAAAFGKEPGEAAVLAASFDKSGIATAETAEELEDLLDGIKGSGELSKYTINIAADLEGVNAGLLGGSPGKTVIYRGAGGNAPYIQVDENVIGLEGNVTFENVFVSSDTIYANGHVLVLGEGFGGGEKGEIRMTVYGGADEGLDLQGGSTSVTVLDGVYKLIAGGNSAGTLKGSTHVTFGGEAKFPTAANGEQDGDTSAGSSAGYNLYQEAEYESSFNPVMVSYTKRGVIPYAIYGGGTDADTTGNTMVEVTGGIVYQIFGGGAAFLNPNYKENGDGTGLVDGDSTVHVTAGEVKSIYGGGYNGIDVYSGDDYSEVPDDTRSTRAVVGGTAHVTIEGNAVVPACEQSEDATTASADPAAVHGGSFHSTVGATEVVVGGRRRL